MARQRRTRNLAGAHGVEDRLEILPRGVAATEQRRLALVEFRILDPPSPRAIADGYALLAELGAVDAENELTPIGEELARLPLDPASAAC